MKTIKKIPKTKTAKILEATRKTTYQRGANNILFKCTKQETKTVMIARFGMLECGKNFKGSLSEPCTTCYSIDDEDHRLNHCVKYRAINFCDSDEKVDFQKIYTEDVSELRELLGKLSKVWNTYNSGGTMNVA